MPEGQISVVVHHIGCDVQKYIESQDNYLVLYIARSVMYGWLIQALVNVGRNYNGPKVAKYLVG